MGSGKPFEGNGETALGFLPVIGTADRNLRPMFGRAHPQKWGGVHGHVDLKGLAEAADTALSCPRPPLESRSPQTQCRPRPLAAAGSRRKTRSSSGTSTTARRTARCAIG